MRNFLNFAKLCRICTRLRTFAEILNLLKCRDLQNKIRASCGLLRPHSPKCVRQSRYSLINSRPTLASQADTVSSLPRFCRNLNNSRSSILLDAHEIAEIRRTHSNNIAEHMTQEQISKLAESARLTYDIWNLKYCGKRRAVGRHLGSMENWRLQAFWEQIKLLCHCWQFKRTKQR